MAKALYGHMARPAVQAQLVAEIARLRSRVRDLEAHNARLTAMVAASSFDPDGLIPAAPDDLADLSDLTDLTDLVDPAFA
jgi:hypothetical protein